VSPTERSLKHLREQGWFAWKTEYWCHFSRRRKDLWNICDILCLRGDEIMAVQTTSGTNVSARVKKIAESEHIGAIREAGIKILVHGWAKRANGRYELREIDCS
jgi:hypothetical protein